MWRCLPMVGSEWVAELEAAQGAGAERLRRALMLGFANRLARRMPQHNGYKTLGAGATLAQLHPATAKIATDDSGLLPEWLIYHELVATARTFLSKARPRLCATLLVLCRIKVCMHEA